MNNAGTPQIDKPADAAVFQWPDALRDTVADSGIKRGATDGYNNLAETLASTVALGDSQVGI